MKKNVLIVMVCMLFIVVLFGCGSDNGNTSQKNPFEKLKVEEADVLSGSGEKIGVRGYVEMDIEDVSEIDVKQLKEFYDSKISGKDYNWFNIFLKDGKALTFTGGMDAMVSYGTVDEDGSISGKQIGDFISTGNEDEPYRYEQE